MTETPGPSTEGASAKSPTGIAGVKESCQQKEAHIQVVAFREVVAAMRRVQAQ